MGEGVRLFGGGKVRLGARGDDAVEIALPLALHARAEEIVRLSQRLGGRGGFSSPREVLAPALVYGLAHMQERYRQAAAREGDKAAGC